MMPLTEKLVPPTVVRPADIDKTAALNIVNFTIWQEEITDYSKLMNVIQQNMKAVFAVIWGQCSESLKDKIKSANEYIAKLTDGDCVWLLTKIKAIMLQFEDQTILFISLSDANLSFASFYQSTEITLTAYKAEYESRIDVVEHYGGSICEYPNLILLVDVSIIGDDERKQAAKLKFLAINFIIRSDKRRYVILIADLANQYTRGNNQYPKDITEAYSMLVNYKTPFPIKNKEYERPSLVVNKGNNDAISEMTGTALLTANTNTVPGTDGKLHEHITCHVCHIKGHYSPDCPTQTMNTGTQHLQMGDPPAKLANNSSHTTEYHLTSTQSDDQHVSIPNTWILLDSQSTVSVFNNPFLLSNIRTSQHPLRVATNGDMQISTQIGDITNYGTVWYNPKSLADIL
jgi:hypothetical protein